MVNIDAQKCGCAFVARMSHAIYVITLHYLSRDLYVKEQRDSSFISSDEERLGQTEKCIYFCLNNVGFVPVNYKYR